MHCNFAEKIEAKHLVGMCQESIVIVFLFS